MNKGFFKDKVWDFIIIELVIAGWEGKYVSIIYFLKKYLTIIKRKVYGIVMYKWEVFTKISLL